METPPPKYFRLFPGNEVRLKHAYFIKCEEVVKDASGRVVELRCTYDPETKSGSGFTGRKVKGTIHWVEASQAVAAEFRQFEPLFFDEPRNAGEEGAELGAELGNSGAMSAESDRSGAQLEPQGSAELSDGLEAGAGNGDASFLKRVNPKSLEIVQGFVESNMLGVEAQQKFQFFRHGYFNVDSKYSTSEKPVFNRIVSLKSSFEV